MRVSFRILASFLAALAVLASRLAAADEQPPNIILIIADDLGINDLGCYGHPTLKTPHIDRLAREGMRFNKAFDTTSSCSPSRASMITGKYPHSTGAEQLHQPLPADQPMFVDALRRQGYWTGAAGKWHLGEPAKKHFDLVLDAAAGGKARSNPSGCGEWLTALERRPKDNPFFLWLASFDPHRPYDELAGDGPQPEQAVLPPYLPDTPEVRREMAQYPREVLRLDGYIGGVLAALDQNGLTDNTLVVFLSDNGRPFPREKVFILDSGVRTPFLMRFPARIPAGVVCDALVSTVDLAATFVALAGAAPWPAPSQNIAPLWGNPQGAVRDYVVAEQNWHDYDARGRAIRDARYKYIRNEYADLAPSPPADVVKSDTHQAMRRMAASGQLTPEQAAPFQSQRAAEEFYDLSADPQELRNVVADPRYATELARLRNELDAWQAKYDDRRPEKRTPDRFDRATGEPLKP